MTETRGRGSPGLSETLERLADDPRKRRAAQQAGKRETHDDSLTRDGRGRIGLRLAPGGFLTVTKIGLSPRLTPVFQVNEEGALTLAAQGTLRPNALVASATAADIDNNFSEIQNQILALRDILRKAGLEVP